MLKLLHVWLRATLTPTVLTAKTSLKFIGCVPSGLVTRMDRARQASDASVVVGLGVCDSVTLAEGAPERERALDTDADADADANANTEREGVLEM